MASLSSLTPITTAATALSNLVLVSPQKTVGYQPQTSFAYSTKTKNSLPAFLFDYEGEQTISLESDITDHYIETNITLQDQIALKPEMITTHGFIGELNDIAPAALQAVQAIANKLVTIGSYTPALSTTALIAYNEAFQAYQIAQNLIETGVSAWGSLTSLAGTGNQGESVVGDAGLVKQTNQNRQQTAFQQFFGYWSNRTLFTVQTPWAVFQNMAIMKLRAVQDSETAFITDFEVTFKRIRTATLNQLGPAENRIVQQRLVSQSAPETNNGAVPVVPDQSISQALDTV